MLKIIYQNTQKAIPERKSIKSLDNIKDKSLSAKEINNKTDLKLFKSLSSEQSVSCRFTNYTAYTLLVNWVDYKGKEVNYGVIERNKEFGQNTYPTHSWAFRDKITNNLKYVYTPTNDKIQNISIGTEKSEDYNTNNFLKWHHYDEELGNDCNKVLATLTRKDNKNSCFTTNPYGLLVDELSKTNSLFIDAEFPRLNKKWKRCSELSLPDKCVFPIKQEINGDHIIQGAVGNCWLHQTLSTLGETKPNEIRDMFFPMEINPFSFYVIKFRTLDDNKSNENEEYSYVVIDDYLALTDDGKELLYAKPSNHFNKNEESCLWVSLLEKAYAKLLGGYKNLEAKHCAPESCHTAIVRVLGGTPNCFSWKFDSISKEDLWLIIECLLESGKSISLSSAENKNNELVVNGMVTFHGYSLFGIKEVKTFQNKIEKLVKVRNTWGKTSYTGKWNYQSKEWIDNPNLAEELKLIKKDNGIFWISYEDFHKNFSILWFN